MKPNEALQILIKHQAWRLGEHDNATEPKDLTKAMNVAIEALESVSKADNGEVKSVEDAAKDYADSFRYKTEIKSWFNTHKDDFLAGYEYHNQFPSVKQCGCMTHCNFPIAKVSDEEIEKAFPCELGQIVIPDEGLTYEQMLLSNYHRRKGAKWMRSRMSNNLNKEV